MLAGGQYHVNVSEGVRRMFRDNVFDQTVLCKDTRQPHVISA